MKIIGAADEFWRIRLTRVDEAEPPDFEWRSDILYRSPPKGTLRESECWRVEAVRLEDYDAIVTIAVFPEREQADSFLERVREDVAEMTKAQFEEAYLAATDDETHTHEGSAEQPW